MAGPDDEQEDREQDVLSALGTVLESGVLGEASRLPALLRHVVTEEIEGRGAELKAYSIGIDVLGRSADFDPNTDSIVRVEFSRLRKALDHYYATVGSDDPLRIDIPKGTYRPKFVQAGKPRSKIGQPSAIRARRPVGSLVAFVLIGLFALAAAGLGYGYLRMGAMEETPTAGTASGAISVAVAPFADLTTTGEGARQGDGLALRLGTALSRSTLLSVASLAPVDGVSSAGAAGPTFVVHGNLLGPEGQTEILVNLIDAASNAIIWGRTFGPYDLSRPNMMEKAIAEIMASLRPRIYGAVQHGLERTGTGNNSAWGLYLRSTWVPGSAISSLAWQKERVRLARMALRIDPDLGEAHSVLADKLAYLANVDPQSDTPALRAEAAFHAQRALALAPNDADAVFNVSTYYWHAGELDKSNLAVRRTLELDPNHPLAPMLYGAIPYTCIDPPLSVLERTVAYDAALARDNPIRWVTLAWVSQLSLNHGDFQQALRAQQTAQQIFVTPGTFYRYAAILTALGRPGQAVAIVNAQRKAWPTLNPHHYADVAMPRRCGTDPRAKPVLALYHKMADLFPPSG